MNSKGVDVGVNGTQNTSQKSKKIDSASIIKHVDLTVEAYLGEAKISIAELGELEADSVVELGASLNQAVELRLNNVPIAHGELVAVGNNFGVRITSIAQ